MRLSSMGCSLTVLSADCPRVVAVGGTSSTPASTMLEYSFWPWSAMITLFYFAQKCIAYQQMIRSVNNPNYRTLVSCSLICFPFRIRGIGPGPGRSSRLNHRLRSAGKS
ncbi:hypothetical protein C8Q74DRAFT_206362 [Fomes fomentarius]|nr:hypothetical protein C8Q74DRAFT_206362 [Fomes fomentarius]